MLSLVKAIFLNALFSTNYFVNFVHSIFRHNVLYIHSSPIHKRMIEIQWLRHFISIITEVFEDYTGVSKSPKYQSPLTRCLVTVRFLPNSMEEFSSHYQFTLKTVWNSFPKLEVATDTAETKMLCLSANYICSTLTRFLPMGIGFFLYTG